MFEFIAFLLCQVFAPSLSVDTSVSSAYFSVSATNRSDVARPIAPHVPGTQIDVSQRGMVVHFGPEPAGYAPSQNSEEIWRIILKAKRHKWNAKSRREASARKFFRSALFFEWCIFGVSLPIFVLLHYHLLDFPSSMRYHSLALFIWLAVAALYGLLIWVRLGSEAGVQWTTGYVLEFIFSIENVFVFHIVANAFKTPQRFIQKALFIVICCQIAFELLFYMGLANKLRRMAFLPYVLGLWLLYVGAVAALEDDSATSMPIKETMVYKYIERLLKDCLDPEYHADGWLFYHGPPKLNIDGSKAESRWRITLLGPVVACLLVLDFLLEIDVTLTKVEELPNEYIAFTSSVVASFAVPELFFVARDLFQRFHLLKYGVSFVLIFFGVQMLLHTYINIPELVGCAIIVCVMLFCMLVSTCTSGSRCTSQSDLEIQSQQALGHETPSESPRVATSASQS